MEVSNGEPLYFDADDGMDSNEESVYESCSDGSDNDDDDDDDDDLEEESEEEDDDDETRVGETEDNDMDISLDSDNDNANSSQCPVCLMSLTGQQLGTPNNCDHVFCFLCISEWSKNSNTCPVDRKKFEEILVHTTKKGPVIKRVKVEDKQVLTDADWEQAPTYCEICNQCNREAMMLLCDGCDRGYHMFCLTPRLYEVPAGDWYCDLCFVIRNETTLDDGFPVPDLVPLTSGVSTSPIPSRERASSTGGRGSSRTGTGSRTSTTRRPKSRSSSTRGRRRSKRGRGRKTTSSRSSTVSSRRKRKMKTGKSGKRKSSKTSMKKSPKKKRKVDENVVYQASLIPGRTPRERLGNSLEGSSANDRVRPLGSRTSLSIFGDEFALHDFEAVVEDEPEEKLIATSRPKNNSSDVLTSIMDGLEVLHDDEARVSRDGSVLPSEQQRQKSPSKGNSPDTTKTAVGSSEKGESPVETGLPLSASCSTTSSKTQVNKISAVKQSPSTSSTETQINISPLKRHCSRNADDAANRNKVKMVSFASISDDNDKEAVNDSSTLSEQSCGHPRDHTRDVRDSLTGSSDLSREHSTIGYSSDSSWRDFPPDYVRYNWKQSRERDFSRNTAPDDEHDLRPPCNAKDFLTDSSRDLIHNSNNSRDSKYLPHDDPNNFVAFVSSGHPSHTQSTRAFRKESPPVAAIKQKTDVTPFPSNNENSHESMGAYQTVDNTIGTDHSYGIDEAIKFARHRISLVTTSNTSTITQSREIKPSRPSLPSRSRNAIIPSSVTMETAMPQSARAGRPSIPVSTSIMSSKHGTAKARTLSSRFDSCRPEVSLATAISKNSGASGRQSLSSRFSTSSISPVVSTATMTSNMPRLIEFERNRQQVTVNVAPNRPKPPSLPSLPANLPHPALPRLKSFKPSESQLSSRPKLKGLSSSSHGYPEPDSSYKQNLAIIDMLRAKKSTLKAEIKKETASLVSTSPAALPTVTQSSVTHSPKPYIEGYSQPPSSSQQLQNRHAHVDADLHRPKLSSLLGQSSRKSSLPVAIVRPRTAGCESEVSVTTENKRESPAVVTASSLSSTLHVKSKAENIVLCDDDEREHNRKKGIARLQRLTSIKDTVRLVLQPFYDHHEISRTEFKDIFVRAVQKVNESNQDVNYLRIADLVKKYVKKYKGLRISSRQMPCQDVTQ